MPTDDCAFSKKEVARPLMPHIGREPCEFSGFRDISNLSGHLR